MYKTVRGLFVEKKVGYQLIIQTQDEDGDNEYIDIDFYIKDEKVNYPGFATEEDRKYIDSVIGGVGNMSVLDYDIDVDEKQIFIELDIEKKENRGGAND